LEIKQKIELVKPAVTFNSGLLNLYRSGADCVSWHSDDEPEPGPEPAIGSVSFGGSRKFQLKPRTSKEKKSIELRHGDYLLMSGKTQRNWLHQVPRTKKVLEPGIHITFRQIFSCQCLLTFLVKYFVTEILRVKTSTTAKEQLFI